MKTQLIPKKKDLINGLKFLMSLLPRFLMFQGLKNTENIFGKNNYTFLKYHFIILNMVLRSLVQLASGNSSKKIKSKLLIIIQPLLHRAAPELCLSFFSLPVSVLTSHQQLLEV